MKNIKLYSEKIKSVASEILSKTNLISILGEFGEVVVGGSYKYNLMWGPDIDIVVKSNNPRESSKKALQKLIELKLFQKYQYGDFAKFKLKNRPESYIVNLRLPYAGQKWEIETWFFRKIPENQLEIDKLIETKLNKENKITILKMKKKRDESGSTKHQISSTEIYKKVLIDGTNKFEKLV
jgi:hypothetical protein